MLSLGCVAFFCAGATPGAAQAVLDFDALTLANYAALPASYGDGFDANIPDVQYRTFTVGTDATLNNFVEFWNADYGDLSKVVYPEENGYAAEIAFVPAAGCGVRLISFDMAGYSHVDRTNSTLRILDAAGNVVLDYVATQGGGVEGDGNGPQHSSFTPNLFVPGTLRIQWGNDWDIGMDNIVFESAPLTVPEPTTTALLGLGGALAAAGALMRRRAARD